MSTREASCSCGQLRVTVTGDPVRVSICHCLQCQRRTGSAFGYQARWPRQAATITGNSTEYVRRSDEDGAGRYFHFCPVCGTTVYYFCEESLELIAVTGGALAGQSLPAPRFSVWEQRMHPWVGLPDGLEHLD